MASIHERSAPAGLNGALSSFVKGFRIRAAIASMRAPHSVLDLGCGLCEIVERLPAGVSYTGVERDPWMFERAQRILPQHRFHKADLESTEFQPLEAFDTILLVAVWEHLRDPAALLARARRWISPQGRFIATTPAPLAHTILEAGSKIGLLSSHADEEHERLWSLDEIERVATAHGWKMAERRRFLLGLNQLFVLEPRD